MFEFLFFGLYEYFCFCVFFGSFFDGIGEVDVFDVYVFNFDEIGVEVGNCFGNFVV